MTKKEFEKLKGIVAENVDRVSELENKYHHTKVYYSHMNDINSVYGDNRDTDTSFVEMLTSINIVLSFVTLIIVFCSILN